MIFNRTSGAGSVHSHHPQPGPARVELASLPAGAVTRAADLHRDRVVDGEPDGLFPCKKGRCGEVRRSEALEACKLGVFSRSTPALIAINNV